MCKYDVALNFPFQEGTVNPFEMLLKSSSSFIITLDHNLPLLQATLNALHWDMP